MNFLGIIPARYASTRFPGKPLVEIGNETILEKTIKLVKKLNLKKNSNKHQLKTRPAKEFY